MNQEQIRIRELETALEANMTCWLWRAIRSAACSPG